MIATKIIFHELTIRANPVVRIKPNSYNTKAKDLL